MVVLGRNILKGVVPEDNSNSYPTKCKNDSKKKIEKSQRAAGNLY